MPSFLAELERLAAESGAPFARLGANMYQSYSRVALGDQHDLAEMSQMVETALAEAREIDDRQYTAPLLSMRAFVELLSGDLSARWTREALVYALETRMWPVVFQSLSYVAVLCARRRQATTAGVLWGYLGTHGLTMTSTAAIDQQIAELLTVVQQLSRADAVTARGAAMTRDEIVAFALESLDAPS